MAPFRAFKLSLLYIYIFIAAVFVRLPVLASALEECGPEQSDNLALPPLMWCKHEAKLIIKAPCDVQVEEYFEVPWVASVMTRTLVVPTGTVDDITASQILSPTSRVPLAILNITRNQDLVINVTIESAETAVTRSAFKMQYLMRGALLRWRECRHDNNSFAGGDSAISWRPGTFSPAESGFLSVEFELPDEFVSGGTRTSNVLGMGSTKKVREVDRTILKAELNKPKITSATNFMATFYLRKDSASRDKCKKRRDCKKEVQANELEGTMIAKRNRTLPIAAWIGIGAGALLGAFLFGLCLLCCCQSKKKEDDTIPPESENQDDGRAENAPISLPMFMRENT